MQPTQIVLASRPSSNGINADLFRVETYEPKPIKDLEVSLRTLYTSIAPFQRQRMNNVHSYTQPFSIGEVIAADSICEVLASKHADFAIGELVIGRTGWQTHPVVHGRVLTRIDASLAAPAQWLSALGSPGLTAYFALFDLAQPRPDDTVVITSAAGAVGGFAGQLAKLAGARVIGIAGGPQKCEHIVRECGYDSALDYRASNFAGQLKQTLHGNVDVFLDLVGGEVADQIFEQLAPRARIVLCGRTASATSSNPGADFANLRHVWVQEASMSSFSLYSYAHRLDEARRRIGGWLSAGRIKSNENHVAGLEKAPQALCDFVDGRYSGRVVIDVT
jgi:NADPH-dependent curcumin reductase CurA